MRTTHGRNPRPARLTRTLVCHRRYLVLHPPWRRLYLHRPHRSLYPGQSSSGIYTKNNKTFQRSTRSSSRVGFRNQIIQGKNNETRISNPLHKPSRPNGNHLHRTAMRLWEVPRLSLDQTHHARSSHRTQRKMQRLLWRWMVKYVALYAIMLFFTAIAMVMKQPAVKCILLTICWLDYLIVMYVYLKNDKLI